MSRALWCGRGWGKGGGNGERWRKGGRVGKRGEGEKGKGWWGPGRGEEENSQQGHTGHTDTLTHKQAQHCKVPSTFCFQAKEQKKEILGLRTDLAFTKFQTAFRKSAT